MHLPWRYTDPVFTVGVDIDVNNINLVALKRSCASSHTFELLAYTHEATTPEFPVISEAIKNALQQMGVNKKSKIVAALSCGQVLTKTMQLDTKYNSDVTKLESHVASYCKKIITYPIHEACMDFELDSDGDIRIAIARRHAVEEKINLFSGSNFTVAAVDIESDALARCINYILNQKEDYKIHKINIALHIASQKILGIVFCHEKVLFSQELPFDITGPEGIKPEDYLEKIKILFPILYSYSKNYVKKQQIYISDNIYLSGINIIFNNIINNIKKITNKNPCLFNPFLIMNKRNNENTKYIEKHAHSLAISCGLAMRDFKN